MPALAANLAQAAFESGSMVKAAVRLGLSQPTVSEVIAELEHLEPYWRGKAPQQPVVNMPVLPTWATPPNGPRNGESVNGRLD